MNTIYLTTLLQATPSLVIPVMIVILAAFALAGVILINRIILRRIRRTSQMTSDKNAIMQQALKISSSNVVYYDISKRYVSKIYGYMMPDEGLTAEEWMRHVHPDDVEMAVHHIREIISGKEKSLEFHYRWNFEYNGGEPRWGYMHNVSVGEYLPGIKRPVGVISTLVDETTIL